MKNDLVIKVLSAITLKKDTLIVELCFGLKDSYLEVEKYFSF